jgi:hypothetical protein
MEHCLHTSPWIDEAHVLLLPHTSGRLGVVAALTPAGQQQLAAHGKRALTQQLREQLSAQFERVLLPRKWRFVATLPLDAQGKSSQAALTALFDESAMHLRVLHESNTQRVLEIHFPQSSTLFSGQCSAWHTHTHFRKIEKLKFSEPIVPDDRVILTLQHLGQGQVQFSYTLNKQPLSSGRIIFEP